jgi:asparagine synthase (glutamine-hydrolysing)
MGGHGGIVCFDQTPVEGSIKDQLCKTIAADHEDCKLVHNTFDVLMAIAEPNRNGGFRELNSFQDAICAVTWEGRLDNSKDLIAALGGEGNQATGTNPASLVAAAYCRWGINGLGKLIGDWSVAIWDFRTQTLALAVDFPGIGRPLFFSRRGSYVAWSSELKTFSAICPGVRLNDEYLARFIVGRPIATQTPFQNVIAVAPGAAVLIRRNQQSYVTCWEPDYSASLRYRKEEDYVEHFRDLFFQVIRDRVTNPQPVWAELSGGVDSSSIVAAAITVANNRLTTVSYRFSAGDTLLCRDDESCRADVLAMLKCGNFVIDCGAHKLQFSVDKSDSFIPAPVLVHERVSHLAKIMAQENASLLMGGQGGDTVMCSNSHDHPYLADLLISHHYLELLRGLHDITQATRKPYTHVINHNVVAPLLFPRDQFSLGYILSRNRWINASRATALPDVDGTGSEEVRLLPSQAYTRDSIRRLIPMLRAQSFRYAAPINVTFPYLDRRVIQFCAAIPFSQRVSPKTNRWLHRRALGCTVPRSVAERRSKPSIDPAFYHWLATQWSEVKDLLGANPTIAQLGIVEPKLLLERAREIKAGVQVQIVAFWRALAAESWTRHAARHGVGMP